MRDFFLFSHLFIYPVCVRMCAQLCLTLWDPTVQQLARLLCLWNFPGISTGVPTPVNLFHYSFMEVDSETFILHSGYNSVLLQKQNNFVLQIVLVLAPWPICSCDSLMHPHRCDFMHLFFVHVLISWHSKHQKMLQVILSISCPTPGVNCFSGTPGYFYWRMIRKQNLGNRCATGASLFLGPQS